MYIYLSSTDITEEQKKRRFDNADTDKDELLSPDEINSMFHPEEKGHMFDVIVEVCLYVDCIFGGACFCPNFFK